MLLIIDRDIVPASWSFLHPLNDAVLLRVGGSTLHLLWYLNQLIDCLEPANSFLLSGHTARVFGRQLTLADRFTQSLSRLQPDLLASAR